MFRTLEIPTTLPTLDETLAWPELRTDDDQRRFFRDAARGTQVHTIHAEVEGRSKAELFEAILDDWLTEGVTFPLLSDLAREALSHHDAIPARPIARIQLPGRGGDVASGWPEASFLGGAGLSCRQLTRDARGRAPGCGRRSGSRSLPSPAPSWSTGRSGRTCRWSTASGTGPTT